MGQVTSRLRHDYARRPNCDTAVGISAKHLFADANVTVARAKKKPRRSDRHCKY